mmetsp:Transcript_31631/g.69122  ORF Transcript_31631/g.69122 Transcript_31631/m.69122 type:complete len:227 (-) Transcript_31631:987-1667(-)
MVRVVIVHNALVADVVLKLEAPAHPSERLQPFRRLLHLLLEAVLVRQIEVQRRRAVRIERAGGAHQRGGGDDPERIQHVVDTRHGDEDPPQRHRIPDHDKVGAPLHRREHRRRPLVPRLQPVRDNPARGGRGGGDSARSPVVPAHHQRPPRAHAAHEPLERLAHRLLARVHVHVLPLNIRNQCHRGQQREEGAVVLVRLQHKTLGGAMERSPTVRELRHVRTDHCP